MYLTFAQHSNSLSEEIKNNLHNELVDYTSPKHESSIRQNALEAALNVNPFDEEVLKNLINGTTHFKWQFSKYSKDRIRELIKNTQYQLLFKSISLNIPVNEQLQLKKIIGD